MKRWGDRLVVTFILLVLAPVIVVVVARLAVIVLQAVAPGLGWMLLGGGLAYWLFVWRGPRHRGGGYR